jgi:ComF family protein
MLIDLLFPKQNKEFSRFNSYLSSVEIKSLKPRLKKISNHQKPFLEGVFVLSNYSNNAIIDLIKRLKFGGEYSITNDLSEALIYHIFKDGSVFIPNPDIIIPIPPDSARLKNRGYDIPMLIAKQLSKYCMQNESCGILSQHIIKIKKTIPQTKLNKKERHKNLKKIFSLSNNNTINFSSANTIWLVDDISTTGTTIYECAKVLKQKYPFLEIWGVVIAGS